MGLFGACNLAKMHINSCGDRRGCRRKQGQVGEVGEGQLYISLVLFVIDCLFGQVN